MPNVLQIYNSTINLLYVSKPFEGVINYNQFYLEKNTIYYQNLKENCPYSVDESFYRSFPLQSDEKTVELNELIEENNNIAQSKTKYSYLTLFIIIPTDSFILDVVLMKHSKAEK